MSCFKEKERNFYLKFIGEFSFQENFSHMKLKKISSREQKVFFSFHVFIFSFRKQRVLFLLNSVLHIKKKRETFLFFCAKLSETKTFSEKLDDRKKSFHWNISCLHVFTDKFLPVLTNTGEKTDSEDGRITCLHLSLWASIQKRNCTIKESKWMKKVFLHIC